MQRTKYQKLVLVTFAAVLGMLSFNAFGEEPLNAARMVRAMQLDKSALLGMQLSMQRGVKDGKANAKQYECVRAVDKLVFTEVFAQSLSSQMTQAEISRAIQFFEGPVGKKYVLHGIVQLYKQTGFPPTEASPNFSDEEYKELERFSKTAAGQKLIAQKITESQAVRSVLIPKVQEIYRGCSQKSS